MPRTEKDIISRRRDTGEKGTIRLNGAIRDQIDTFRTKNVNDMRSLNVLYENEAGNSVFSNNRISGIDRTHVLSQQAIRNGEGVTEAIARNLYELNLPDGPYRNYFTNAGDYSLLAGRRGHLALIRMKDMNMEMETHLDDEINCAAFLNNKNLFAVGRPSEITILDNKGLELHNLTEFKDTKFIEYLPHHWLLAHTGDNNSLYYHDITTGKTEGHVFFRRPGLPTSMCQNKKSAFICTGHTDGCVSLCAPSVTSPLATIRCHPHGGAVLAVACDPRGDKLVTAGMDGMLRVWDIRNYSKCLCEYNYQTMFGQGVKAVDLDVSQTGLVALGMATGVHVFNFNADPSYKDIDRGIYNYKSAIIDNGAEENRILKAVKDKVTGEQITEYSYKSLTKPYISHMFRNKDSRLVQIGFRPYEDSLTIGLTSGVQSIIVPGSGLAEFDTYQDNIYETSKQRSENVVRGMLEKIPAYMIAGANQLTEVKKLTENEKVRLGLNKITAAMSNTLTKKHMESKSRGGAKAKTVAKQNAKNSQKRLSMEEAERRVKTHIGFKNDGSRIDNKFMDKKNNKKGTRPERPNSFSSLLK